MHNKIFISADFEAKNFRRNEFFSYKWHMAIKSYFIIFQFDVEDSYFQFDAKDSYLQLIFQLIFQSKTLNAC